MTNYDQAEIGHRDGMVRLPHGRPMTWAAAVVLVGVVFLTGTEAASASPGTLHSRWLAAARVTAHTSEYRSFCIQHRGNDHFWREGFCQGDLANYPDYGQLSAPPGYQICYVRESVRAGEIARIALSHGVRPRHHLHGC